MKSKDPTQVFASRSKRGNVRLFEDLFRDYTRLQALERKYTWSLLSIDNHPKADKALLTQYGIENNDPRYSGHYEGNGEYNEGTVYDIGESDDDYDGDESQRPRKKRKLAPIRHVVLWGPWGPAPH